VSFPRAAATGEPLSMDREIDRSLPTPDDLMESPELAVLRVLQATLEIVEVALKATYPGDAEAAESNGRTEPEAYAMVILYQIEVLGHLIQEYVRSLGRLRDSRDRRRDEDEVF
jgi:hypothetical protein